MTRHAAISYRTADITHAADIDALISASLSEGHLLPRTLAEIGAHVDRFVVAMTGDCVVGCAELAPLSARIAEVRSLAVDGAVRGLGVGTALVDEVRRRARRGGYDTLCAFTHAPAYFIHLGFSIVPHPWVPEKIFTDCSTCARFRQCGQFAMVAPLDASADLRSPVAATAGPVP